MTDSETPSRGPGRPRTASAGAERRNVTVQLHGDTYELLKRKADVSGQSLSKVIDQAIKDSLFTTAQDEAVSEAIADYDQSTVDHFNGKLAFFFASFASKRFVQCVSEAAKEQFGSSVDFTEEESGELFRILCDPKMRSSIAQLMIKNPNLLFDEFWALIDSLLKLQEFSNVLTSMSKPDLDDLAGGVRQALRGRLSKNWT